MHSSRMRAVRSSSRLLGMCLPRGVSAGGESGWRGVCLGGVGGCLPGGCLSRGSIPACTGADTTPVDRMPDRCKNITFPPLRLRTVIKPISPNHFSWTGFGINGQHASSRHPHGSQQKICQILRPRRQRCAGRQ